MSEHAITVIIRKDGRWRAMCACGYRGVVVRERQQAEIQIETHLAYHRDVAQITAATGGEGS